MIKKFLNNLLVIYSYPVEHVASVIRILGDCLEALQMFQNVLLVSFKFIWVLLFKRFAWFWENLALLFVILMTFCNDESTRRKIQEHQRQL